MWDKDWEKNESRFSKKERFRRKNVATSLGKRKDRELEEDIFDVEPFNMEYPVCERENRRRVE